MRIVLVSLVIVIVASVSPARAADEPPAASPAPVAAAPAPVRPIARAAALTGVDPAGQRIALGYSVRPSPARTWSWSTAWLALWRFEYTPVKGLDLGVTIAPPVGAMFAVPHVRWAYAADNGLGVSVGATAGGVRSFGEILPRLTGYGNSVRGVFGGGHAAFGWADPAHRGDVVLGIDAYYARGGATLSDSSGVLLVPRLGGTVRVHPNVKIVAEVTVPMRTGLRDGSTWSFRDGPLLTYGVRVFGRDNVGGIFGDVSLILPMNSRYFDGVGQVWPLGYPFLVFGMRL